MGIKGTVRRSTDGHFIHCNVDTDVIISEEPPFGSKQEESVLLAREFLCVFFTTLRLISILTSYRLEQTGRTLSYNRTFLSWSPTVGALWRGNRRSRMNPFCHIHIMISDRIRILLFITGS